jgi:hypothetical protein
VKQERFATLRKNAYTAILTCLLTDTLAILDDFGGLPLLFRRTHDTICTLYSKSPGLEIVEETVTGSETLHGSRSLEKYLAQGQKDAIDCR